MKRSIRRRLLSHTVLFVVVLAALARAQVLYWTDVGTSKIQRIDVVAGGGEDLVTTPHVFEPVDIALDVAGGKMYWTEASPADFMIGRANLDGTNHGNFVTGLFSPSGIGLDVAAGKIYWSDIGTGKIQRADLDYGTNVEDLVSVPGSQPVDIALDLVRGKMYWTEASPADFMVLRANLDGSSQEGIVVSTGTSPSGIAVDTIHEKIYWTDLATGRIQRANLDGSGIEGILTPGVSVIEPVRIALDVVAGKMYWTEGSAGDFQISRANLDGSGAEYLVTGLFEPSGIALDAVAGPSIPATSAWGLLAMAAALVAAGAWSLRRKMTTPAPATSSPMISIPH